MKNLIPAEVASQMVSQKDVIIDAANRAEYSRYLGKNYFDDFEFLFNANSKTYRLFIRTDCADIADNKKALVVEVYNGKYPDSKDFVDEVTLTQINLNSYFGSTNFIETLKENTCA